MNFISVLILLLLGFVWVEGHSYVTTPITRGNQRQSQSGCRGPACLGPCEVPLAQKTTVVATVARGSIIQLTWPRNNHAGGFVRFAWAPTSQSDAMSVFDTNAQLYTCFEIGTLCAPSDPTNPNGGDTGGQYCCGYSLTVPGWVTDGAWTLQWAWFGGAFSLGDYYSCMDYTISGGPTATQGQPVFIGGDYADPGLQVCKFWNTDKLHECIDEPCNSVILPGQNVGPVDSVAIAISGANSGGSGGGSASGSGSGTGSGGLNSQSESDINVPCSNNTQCSSGVCQMNGFCFSGSSKKLDAGGIAALFFAFLFVIVVVTAVLFVVVNKSEWKNWRPFKA